MSDFINLYIFSYSLTFLCIFVLLKNSTLYNNKYYFKNSISSIFSYINNFYKYKSLLIALLFSITGIPPFIFFFIKFNFIISAFINLDIYTILIVFFIFFSNMIFYSQFFFHKNTKINFSSLKKQKQELSIAVLFFIKFNLFISWTSLICFCDIYFSLHMIF